MKNGGKLLVGALAGAGLLWGARAILRSRRRIELAGRVVVITGGTTGLGLLLARQASAEGAIVVVAGRDEDELRAVEGELRREGAREALGIHCDVTVQPQVEALIERVVGRFGRIDVLVNNAGTIIVGPVETMTLDDFRLAMDTNYWGAVYTTLAALPHLERQGSGRIVNIGSVGALIATPHLLPYTASKFALAGFSEGLRAELASKGILVTLVHPGLMHTGGHTHAMFKGDAEAEYAWFSVSDTMPGVSMPVEAVARRVWEAAKVGDPILLLGWNARLGVAFRRVAPEWFLETMALVDRMLPPTVNVGAPAIPGEQLTGRIPSVLNRAVPASARPGTA